MAKTRTYSDPDRQQRNLDKRGPIVNDGKSATPLKTSLPKSNIVRIEVLDGYNRQRYLSSVQREGDELRSSIYQNITQTESRVFYGFIDTQKDTPTFNMNTEWATPKESDTLLGGVKGLVKGASNFAASSNIPLISGAGKILGGTLQAVESIGNIAGRLTGINGSVTGGGTMKAFRGVKLESFSVKCGWYLPEQYYLCIKSLKILYRMAYPRQIEDGDIKPEEFAKAVNNMVDAGSDAIFNNDTDKKVATAAISSEDADEEQDAETVQKQSNEPSGLLIDTIKAGVQATMPTFFSVSKAFGKNFTFNPLPVRVSYGQSMDIEPLVIQKVDTTFSKETFITADGKHRPIFVETTIAFNFWLTPAPNLEFASLFGEELFGPTTRLLEDPPTPKPVQSNASQSRRDNDGWTTSGGMAYNTKTGQFVR